MSGVEVLAVVACVAAVVSAYHDGSGLVKKIKERRRARKALKETEAGQLENSLELGPRLVQGQYDHDFRRFGQRYASGDQIAREQMKDVLITLQLAVLQNLRGIWNQDVEIDYMALQIASDDSRVNAVVCLGQLYQRLSQAAPPDAMQIPMSWAQQLSSVNNMIGQFPMSESTSSSPAPRSERVSGSSSSSFSQITMTPPHQGMNSSSHTMRQSYTSQLPHEGSQSTPQELPSYYRPFPDEPVRRSNGSNSYPAGLSASPDEHGIRAIPPLCPSRNQGQKQPAFPKVAVRAPEQEELHYADPNRLSHTSSHNSRVHHDPDDFDNHPVYNNPWTEEKQSAASAYIVPNHAQSYSSPPQQQQSSLASSTYPHESSNRTQDRIGLNIPRPLPSQAYLQQFANDRIGPVNSRSASSQPYVPQFASSSSPPPQPAIIRSSTTNSNFIRFPSESNNYAGFCKGAWKLQVEGKKAFEYTLKPMGMTGMMPVWRCSKCEFEGPMASGPSKGSHSFDNRVRRSPNGEIKYRWTFLAKCHVENKNGAAVVGSQPRQTSREQSGIFGCIFCCAEGLVVSDNMSVHSNGSSINSNTSPPPTKEPRRKGIWPSKSKSPSISSPSPTPTATQVTTSTPLFGNVAALMSHLDEHRREGREPSSAVLERTKCIIGRIAHEGEEFDINLPPLRVQEIA